jgi:hypothetical protein
MPLEERYIISCDGCKKELPIQSSFPQVVRGRALQENWVRHRPVAKIDVWACSQSCSKLVEEVFGVKPCIGRGVK